MAIATAIVTFSATGPDSLAFTWTPALTNPTPKVLSCSVSVPSGGGCTADVLGAPTDTGGTVRISCPTNSTVTLRGSD